MIILILLIYFQSTFPSVYAVEQPSYYARILFEQVYLYKTPTEDNSLSNLYFELPKTYFVELVGKNGNFYEVNYLNFVGYVKKDSVQAVSGTPSNPYLKNISFRVYSSLSENLWSTPSTEDNSSIISTIPHLTNNIEYIGKINGQELIEGRTSVWYYCKFSSYYGYIFSDFCDEMTKITNNTENLTYISNPTFEVYTPSQNSIPIESNAAGIVIAILSMPALAFIFLFIKGSKFTSKEKLKNKEVVDY